MNELNTLTIVLAVLFGAGNATSMLLAVLGKPWAWLVVIVSQSLNITYLVVTGQVLVLIGGQPVCLVIGLWGLHRWLTKGVHRDPRRRRAEENPTLADLTMSPEERDQFELAASLPSGPVAAGADALARAHPGDFSLNPEAIVRSILAAALTAGLAEEPPARQAEPA